MNGAAIVFAGGCALAFGGLAVGAMTIEEAILVPEQEGSTGAATFIPLTALLVATGVTIAVAALAGTRRGMRWRRRVLPLATIAAASYLATVLWQSAIVNFDAIDARQAGGSRLALFAVTPLVADAHGPASLLLPVLAIGTALVVATSWAWSRLADRTGRGVEPGRHAAATLLFVPFPIVAAAGSIALLRDVPPGSAYTVVLPLLALLALALAAVPVLHTWIVASVHANARLRERAVLQWALANRIGLAVGSAFVLLAIGSLLLPRMAIDVAVGRNLAASLRAHNALLPLMGLVAIPLLRHARRGGAALATFSGDATLVTRDPRGVLVVVAAAASAVLAVVAAFIFPGALAPWLAALIPCAVAAWWCRGHALPLALLLGGVLWSFGNTVTGSLEAGEGIMRLGRPPALLATVRILAIAVVVPFAAHALTSRAGLYRLASSSCAALLGVVVLVEMSLAAWLASGPAGESIILGTLLASQDAAVAAVLHVVAALAAAAAAWALWKIRPAT